MDCYFYTSANGEWQVVVCDLCFFFIISINGLIFIHFCKWRFWDIYIRKDACSLRSRLSLFWYPAISQFCDSIIRIAYHTAIYKCYTIIHGCGGDGSSHPVTMMPQGKKRQPRRKNGRQERLRNQVNRKSGTCEFRRSSRMVTCQRGFWDIWNTDNKKTRSGIRTLSYTHGLPYGCSDNHIWYPCIPPYPYSDRRAYRYRRISMSGHMAIRVSGGISPFPSGSVTGWIRIFRISF